ncbi:MAG: orotate phosphoribosyltransferase [Pseudomonadota bacterium]|nr:orotate phosphoribosyltransferase [Pseudomonadota bacterium]MEC7957651.1 orotate phosphoribosyltransferase [Pseudomonadota bacterium]MEC9133561.1 orotate phosphoribosyltransferase [Pseudomonadota bacterium]MEE3175699.1 orotate phosphoribosyltransferase [Pseudomonadota bacterium]GIS18873.1 MAG: orotate phosphoribosyltransferase [Pseudomonadota bacterium]
MEKRRFIDFLIAQDVLKFGEFTLNSGRISPYFFNLGAVSDGAGFAELGRAYAQTIVDAGLEFDVLFGPAYKGIPIAVATATALAAQDVHVSVAYNRKEAKDHGEGGQLVGAEVTGRVLLVDDVLTSGKAIRQSVDLIAQTDAEIVGTVIALDRAELVAGEVTAVEALANDLQAPIVSIASVADIIERLADAADLTLQQRMLDYQQQYCRMS